MKTEILNFENALSFLSSSNSFEMSDFSYGMYKFRLQLIPTSALNK